MAKVSLRAYNREIETMIDRGHLDEAIANCRHILKTFPKHLETYRLLGKAYLEYKRYSEAVDVFSRVLAAVPNDFVAHVGMSIIRDEENKLDDAIRHMERAFETQPSNAAIQSELQRLYGRRDGVQPPRIRMTRGALAHMYVQGELYPQAISEIKSVLKEDGSRVDMQTLLARASYRSGLKSEAAEAASAALRTHPYSLDANRVLVEVLGSERAENAQQYRQRVVDLDPYAAHVTGTVFQSSEVADAAVSLERLDWNGQPVGLPSDWSTQQAITAEAAPGAQPDWLRNVADEPPTQPPRPFTADQPAATSAFDMSAPAPKADESEDDIPEFLRAAGWGESTGAFDESKAAGSLDEPESGAPISKGDLPDWIKAMAPSDADKPSEDAGEAEEELPDWINKIGAGVTSSDTASADAPDWMSQADQPASAGPDAESTDAQFDWLGQLDKPGEGAAETTESSPEWLTELQEPGEAAAGEAKSTDAESSDLPDWMTQTETPGEPASSATDDQPAWLKPSAEPAAAPAGEAHDDLAWLRGLGTEAESTEAARAAESDFVMPETESSEPAAASMQDQKQPAAEAEKSGAGELDKLGASEQEQDDSFAWLEGLAARQGASEGLLTKPEERLEEEPDWVKRAKGTVSDQTSEPEPPTAGIEELGRSEQERDDSFAWLEGLAARQGASEGLLTKPEERSEEEPDWVKKARDTGPIVDKPVVEPEAEEQTSSVHDTAAWLRSLDDDVAEAPPTTEEDPTGIWLKSLDEGELKQAFPPKAPEAEVPSWMQEVEQEQPAETGAPADETSATAETGISAGETEADMPAWLHGIEREDEASEPTTGAATSSEPVGAEPARPAELEETGIPSWMQSIVEEPTAQEETSQVEAEPASQATEMPDWMQYIEDQAGTDAGSQAPAASATEDPEPETAEAVEQPAASDEESMAEAITGEDEIPAWLSTLDEDESRAVTPAAGDEDLPAWLRGDRTPTGQLSEPEPTRESDWKPVEDKQPAPPEAVIEPTPEPVAEPVAEMPTESVAAAKEPKPAAPAKPAKPAEPSLDGAREDLARGDIASALATYGKLIKKTRLLEDVIYDLREALYRYPVDVGIWQSLGDAYMRANRLQDALDAYTKAEELLR